MKKVIVFLGVSIVVLGLNAVPANAAVVAGDTQVINAGSLVINVYDNSNNVFRVKPHGYVLAEDSQAFTAFKVARGTNAKVYPTDPYGNITGPALQVETTTGKHKFNAAAINADLVAVKLVTE